MQLDNWHRNLTFKLLSRRKYALAAIDEVLKLKPRSTQKLGVMYDIICLCQKQLEVGFLKTNFPELW